MVLFSRFATSADVFSGLARSLPARHPRYMPSLFDSLGPAFRAPDVSAALESLAADSEVDHGAVFARPEVATAILDLCGYSVDRALHRLRLLQPSFGGGDFLLRAATSPATRLRNLFSEFAGRMLAALER